MKIIWSRRALADLVRLREFLAKKNPDAARRAIAAIRHSIVPRRAHPEIGRPVGDLPDGFRDWPIAFGDRGYVARYHVNARGTTILRVRHMREAGF